MTATEVWILIDPAQFHEESAVILGVYGSFQEAQAARPEHWRATRPSTVTDEDLPRMREAQLWRGEQCVKIWTYDPRADTWLEDTHAGALIDAEEEEADGCYR